MTTTASETTAATRLVTVRYFAAAAEAAGREEEQLELPAAASAAELRDELVARYGEPIERVLTRGSLLIDGVVTRDPGRPLGERVDVLPPFAGG